MRRRVERSEEEWRKTLEPQEFEVLRKKGTEAPFTGRLYHNERKGRYVCAGCGKVLFLSDDKFDSGSGWPSFVRPAEDDLDINDDLSHGMVRKEVVCPDCGGHLGHVFDDGPAPTRKRYCINSLSLKFEPEE